MSRTAGIVLSTVVWCALFAYIVFAARMCSGEKERTMLNSVDIRVSDGGGEPLVTTETVRGWLKEDGYDLNNIELAKVNTDEIRASIAARGLVRKVKIYSDMNGVLHIEVGQRKPVARVNTQNGYNFYITDDGWVLQMKKLKAVYVPIVTGVLPLPFGRDFEGSIDGIDEEDRKKSPESYSYLLKLVNFVNAISDDPFWNSQIVQINVGMGGASGLGAAEENTWKEPEIELIPRIGKHIVVLGSLDDTRQKLDKLMLFYRKVLDYEGWDAYSRINLRYKGQVVCTPAG